MNGIFRNKFFLICLIVICGLTVAAMALNIAGRGNIVSDAVSLIIYPFNKFAGILSDSAQGFAAYFTEFKRLKNENAELKARVAELEDELEDENILKERIDFFNGYYELKQEHTEYMLQDAKVIAGDAGNLMSVIIINKGSLHELDVNMPVITERGIVGYISEVGFLTSKVTLIIKPSISIGAYIKRTDKPGVAEGDFELERKQQCKLVSLSKDTDIEEGDEIYSSGLGGIYPEGLYIGKVTRVEIDPYSQTHRGIIEPAVDFLNLTDVMVIKQYTKAFY